LADRACGRVRPHGNDCLQLQRHVTIQNSEITSTGQLGQSELIYVMGSLADTQNPDNVDCTAGEVLVRLPTRTGAGLDAVSLSCSTPTCN